MEEGSSSPLSESPVQKNHNEQEEQKPEEENKGDGEDKKLKRSLSSDQLTALAQVPLRKDLATLTNNDKRKRRLSMGFKAISRYTQAAATCECFSPNMKNLLGGETLAPPVLRPSTSSAVLHPRKDEEGHEGEEPLSRKERQSTLRRLFGSSKQPKSEFNEAKSSLSKFLQRRPKKKELQVTTGTSFL